MMRTKSLIVFVLIFTSFNPCVGQDHKIIPPTPTAYSLGKYGDIPVSAYTGVPNISIPIYSLTNRDLSVDVSFSYHGGGNKVDEMASFVGLGWTLNAGGCITRVVRGRPETLLSNGTFFYPRKEIQSYVPSENKTDYVYNNNLLQIANGQYDAEPDIFYYNFQGKSGKFYFDKDRNPVFEKDEPLKIEWQYVSPDIAKFIVTDELGKRFEFANYETTYDASANQNTITGWYLTKITSPTGNEITFEYSGAASGPLYARPYSSSVVELIQGYNSITQPNTEPNFTWNSSEIRPIKISSELGSVEFVYQSTRRQDYSSAWAPVLAATALDEIKIKNANNVLVKKFKLSTSYFEANNARKYDGTNPSNYTFLNYRLRLDGIQEYASDNTTINPPFTFVYFGDNNPTTDDDYTLPYRFSPQQDHWG